MTETQDSFDAAQVFGLKDRADVLFLCEHASNALPGALAPGGLPEEIRQSHVAWDPGALDLARRLAADLGAPVVAGGVSRLLYDCNRPPTATDAIPARSEIHDIPFNSDLTDAQRADRVARIYQPFCEIVEAALERARPAALVTVHSFTRVYFGKERAVQIGVLHDADARLADALLARLEGCGHDLRRNEPYGPADGVTHSLRNFALPRGLPNVMLEVRSDLLTDDAAVRDMAALLTPALRAALADIGVAVRS